MQVFFESTKNVVNVHNWFAMGFCQFKNLTTKMRWKWLQFYYRCNRSSSPATKTIYGFKLICLDRLVWSKNNIWATFKVQNIIFSKGCVYSISEDISIFRTVKNVSTDFRPEYLCKINPSKESQLKHICSCICLKSKCLFCWWIEQ